MIKSLTPRIEPVFERGPALVPADPLVAWLDAQVRDGQPRLVRLPIVLRKDGPRFARRGVRIGGSPEALVVRCTDYALGIPLDERARIKAGDADTCALRVEGFWRGRPDVEAPAPYNTDFVFDVVYVFGHVPLDELARFDFAEVEALESAV